MNERGLLNIHVYRARDLGKEYVSNGCDTYVELRLGNHIETTKSRASPEWNQAFTYSKHKIQAPTVEFEVKSRVWKKARRDVSLGRIIFNLEYISTSATPLSPHWYRLQDRKGDKVTAELLVAIWINDVTQMSVSPTDAGNSTEKYLISSSSISSSSDQSVGGEYLLPNFWYVRVNVIEAHDLLVQLQPKLYVLAMLGNQSLRTKHFSDGSTSNPQWKEELLFVASEPFEEPLVLTVEERLGKGSNNQVCGRCVIPLPYIPRMSNDEHTSGRWYDLSKQVVPEDDFEKKTVFAGRIHVTICVEAGYHVLLGPKGDCCSCDYMPPERTPCIGTMELHVIEAHGLLPMKKINGQARADAYCVVQYGKKWVRTKTIFDSLNPKWNEQYCWQVFDPCTIVTIGLFDDSCIQDNQGFKDSKFGKVRIQLSTLRANQQKKVELNYPILYLSPSGLKKMGEIKLAVRLTYSSWLTMLSLYSQPLLPIKHYLDPLEDEQQIFYLQYSITDIISRWFDQSEPRLRREIVEYMLDVESKMYSLRKLKAKYALSLNVLQLYDQTCNWKNPLATLWIHVLLITLLLSPKLLPTAIFLSLSLVAILNYQRRTQQHTEMDLHPSLVDIDSDELDEEFDTFPTSRRSDTVKMRYDRLRNIAAKIQNGGADLAANLERLQNLVLWRDPRATAIFMAFCLISVVVLYLVPFRVVLFVTGLYLVRHPKLFRVPLFPVNFFARLPTMTDMML
ncbi:FT-interacting protein 3 [Beta vulgaris subsp. vulgaris]|uniref:FT-interacting protein 3 n=1 Tax=Beta vulgaris subsp. vulgaris TaxID=3555 RepID=UPI00203692AE|nr:FT-interacting protein 3 [Beta vulgaris subsp. vulgaris]